MKKLLAFVIVVLMTVSAIIPAFALSEAPATPDPAENHINIWVEDAEFDPSESETVDVYVSISDNTDGFEYMKFYLVYPNCLTYESMEAMDFAEDLDGLVNADSASEHTAIDQQFIDSLEEAGYNEDYDPLDGGKYKWIAVLYDFELKEKINGKNVAVDCFENGQILKVTFSYDASLNTEFGNEIPIIMYDAPENQLHCYRKGYEWSDEVFIACVHNGVIKINQPAQAEDVYYVVGEGTDAFEAFGWTAFGDDNVMTKNADGTYSRTFTAAEEANFAQLKVVKHIGGDPNEVVWYGNADGSNVKFSLSGEGEFTVTFDPDAEEITLSGDIAGAPKLSYSVVCAVGSGEGNFLNGVNWDPAADVNIMTEVEDDIWEITFSEVEEGYFRQIKFALDGSWAVNFGGTFEGSGVTSEAIFNGDNIEFDTYELCNITVRLDLSNFNIETSTGATFCITIEEIDTHEHNFIEQVDEAYLVSAADCTSPAVYYKSCEGCGLASEETFTYGEALGHNFIEKVDDEYLVSEADCENAAVYYKSCERCGIASEETFDYGEALGHNFIEKVADEYLVSEADCDGPAVYYKSCERCGIAGEDTFENGNALAHNFIEKVADEYLVSEADCENPAVYLKSCELCGIASEETFEYGEALGHDFTDEVVDEKYLKDAADCLNAAVYFKSCSRCHIASETDTFESGEALGHDFIGIETKPSCTEGGYTTYTCTRCSETYDDDYTDPLDHSFIEKVDEEYLVSEADCENAAVYFKSCERCGLASEETFTYGEALGHNFIEKVADEYLVSEADCENPAVYYKSCERCGIASEETFDFGEALGHNFIEKVADEYLVSEADCESPAVYYKSCERCGIASEETFDFGEALGHDFTDEIVDAQYLKSEADCVNPAVYYKSCTRCHAASETETFTYGDPAAHNFTAEVVDAKYLKSEADCTNAAVYFKSCTGCGLASETETFNDGEALGHDFTDEVVDEKYLKDAADCLNAAVYYKSCTRCHIASETETFSDGEALGHDFTDEVVDAKYLKSAADCLNAAVYYKSCTRCHIASETETFNYGEAKGHTFTAEVVDAKYLKSEADCTNAAVYFKSCVDCGLASETETFEYGEAKGHTFTAEVVDAKYLKSEADCTNAAVYFKSCVDCGLASETETFNYGEAKGHTFTAEVVDAKYLKSEADCTNAAVYFKSCVDCGLASETETFNYGEAKGHTFTAEVVDAKYLKSEADCTNAAVYFKSCVDCGLASETETFNDGEALGHDFTDEVVDAKYLKDEADCTNAAVYYKSCTRCHIASETETFSDGEALGHDYQLQSEVKPSCTELGSKTYKCSRCPSTYTDDVDMIPHTPGEWVLVREATPDQDGLEYLYCTTCENKIDERAIAYIELDISVVPSARLASYEIDNRTRTINVVAKLGQPKAVYSLKLPKGAKVTMSDAALEAGNAMMIKNVVYTEATEAEGIRYMITYADKGYDQKYTLEVTDKDGSTYEYTVNVTFLHDPLLKSVVPGYAADSALTHLDAEESTIYIVAKPNMKNVSFNLSLVGGSTVEVTSEEKPHFIQKVGTAYAEVTEIDNSRLVYFRTYKTDADKEYDIRITATNGYTEDYHVVVEFPN
ncbi:MAG: hypothetical protein IJS45_09280 [Clostridia bacterium]|nr:hypothetical protein [Clostridia bacterium]